MPSTSREVIDHAIIAAIHESGGIGIRIPTTAAHPRTYLVVKNGVEISLWIYCWTLTPGGRKTLPDEYRIQMTSVSSPLPLNVGGHTVLLGYDPDRGVFAGFDLARHHTFTGRSPSVQIRIATLNECLQDGLAFQKKSNDEIAVGIRPDLFLYYLAHAHDLHEMVNDETYFERAERAAKNKAIDESEILDLPQRRQLVIRETARWARSTSFFKQVLNAYDYRCAVTRRKLKLVDAAHILPVAAGERSIDTVRNGIALSPTYHRAFDNGLIYLDETMVMRLNHSAAADLAKLGLSDGIDSFAAHLGKIHLPYNPEQHPDPYFIQLANGYRGV